MITTFTTNCYYWRCCYCCEYYPWIDLFLCWLLPQSLTHIMLCSQSNPLHILIYFSQTIVLRWSSLERWHSFTKYNYAFYAERIQNMIWLSYGKKEDKNKNIINRLIQASPKFSVHFSSFVFLCLSLLHSFVSTIVLFRAASPSPVRIFPICFLARVKSGIKRKDNS